MYKLERFARIISDKRSDIRLGIFIVSEIAIIIKARYTTAIIAGLTVLAIVTCCCRIYSLRHENPDASLFFVLRKSLYSIIFSAAMLMICGLLMFY